MMLLPSEFMEIVAYMPQNALLVRGLPEEIDQLKEMIAWLDQPAQQVEISCKFVSINVTDNKALGIDWQVSNGQLEFWNLGFAPSEAVNNVVRFARGRFQAELRAAVSSGRATVLAEPIVTTQNNMPAEIDFYTEIPYFIAVVTYNEFGNREVDFETDYAYIDNMLSVTPRINADDTVTMEIYPEIDQQVGTVEGPNGERIPITSNWYIYVPQVTVADGETLVIGGIISKSQDEQIRKTPLLSEIPLVGNLFQSKRRTINNTETLIFVTPRIVRPIPRD
jgi:type II secretory pathway component GspD/PulD (secretin)